VIETVRRAIATLAGQLNDVTAIGVACAGQIEPESGVVVQAANLGWRNVPLVTPLAETFRIPVVIENDVRAAAWGEYRFGLHGNPASLLAVFVGTGVGSGAVLDGRLWRGAGNAAGELGHTPGGPGGPSVARGRPGRPPP